MMNRKKERVERNNSIEDLTISFSSCSCQPRPEQYVQTPLRIFLSMFSVIRVNTLFQLSNLKHHLFGHMQTTAVVTQKSRTN